MRKVVLVNQSSGYLMIDIVNAYLIKYDKVVLISGSIKVTERVLDDRIIVSKIIAYNRSSSLKRLLTWCWGTLQVYFKLLLKYRDYEVVFVTNTPMSYLLALGLKRKFSVIVYEVYPEALKNVGITSNNFLFRTWEGWNRKLFKKAEKIVTLSGGMGKLLEKYVDRDKIKIIPNWSASEQFNPISKEFNPFIKEHHLEGKFVVMYSGNIGYTHNVEYLIEVAKELKQEKEIQFLIIGEGKKKETLQTMVKEYGLTSCLFLTWQDKTVLPYSLGAADLAVITLNDETAFVSVPSKTYNLLAVGAPLLCIAPECSELSNLVQQYNNGRCFNKEAVREMADYIIDLKNNPDKKALLSRFSLEASKDFTYKNALKYV